MSNQFAVHLNQNHPKVNVTNAGQAVDTSYEDDNLSDGVTFNYQASHTYGSVTIDQSNFAEFDTDNNGSISQQEFQAKVGNNPAAIKAWKKEGIKNFRHGFGKNNGPGVNGVSKSLDQSKVSGSITITKENFQSFDVNHDKKITKAEFKRQLHIMGIPDTETEKLLALFNTVSGDGELALTDLENAVAPIASTDPSPGPTTEPTTVETTPQTFTDFASLSTSLTGEMRPSTVASTLQSYMTSHGITIPADNPASTAMQQLSSPAILYDYNASDILAKEQLVMTYLHSLIETPPPATPNTANLATLEHQLLSAQTLQEANSLINEYMTNNNIIIPSNEEAFIARGTLRTMETNDPSRSNNERIILDYFRTLIPV